MTARAAALLRTLRGALRRPILRRSRVAGHLGRAGLALAILTGSASAAIVQRLDLNDLVQGADTIVVGQVIDLQSRFEGTRIVTRVQVRADAVLKGSPGAVVEVEVLGGEVDGLGQQVSGMASFTAGEQVALFLEHHGAAFRTVGLAQGKLHIEASAPGVQVVHALDGLTLVARNAAGELVPAPTLLPTTRGLAEFLVDVTDAIAAPSP